MKNFDYANKFHYVIKYLILAFPVILLLIACMSQNQQVVYTWSNNQISSSTLSTTLNLSVLDSLKAFYTLPINLFYSTITYELFNFSYTGNWTIVSYLLYYPLWVMWTFTLDLVLDLIVLIPKLAHCWMEKLGGKH